MLLFVVHNIQMAKLILVCVLVIINKVTKLTKKRLKNEFSHVIIDLSKGQGHKVTSHYLKDIMHIDKLIPNYYSNIFLLSLVITCKSQSSKSRIAKKSLSE